MEDRHTAEVIELKKLKLQQINLKEGFDDGADERQMLVNLVKVKDEEIKQLKMQLSDIDLDKSNVSPERSSVSPLRKNQ